MTKCVPYAHLEVLPARPQISTAHGSDQREKVVDMQGRKDWVLFADMNIGVLHGGVNLPRRVPRPPASQSKSRQTFNNARKPGGMPRGIEPLQHGRPKRWTESAHVIRSIRRQATLDLARRRIGAAKQMAHAMA